MSNTTSTYFNKLGTQIKFTLEAAPDETPAFCLVTDKDSQITRVAINVSKISSLPKWEYSNVNFESFAAAYTAMLNIVEYVQKLMEIDVKGDL